MKTSVIRRIALVLIAILAFAQTSVAFAACAMERGDMAQMASTGDDCCGGPLVQSSEPQLANACVAHCTADLQLPVAPMALVHLPADTPVLLLQQSECSSPHRAVLEQPPPRAVPSRILLHSFLI
jgi:hypothetical protein